MQGKRIVITGVTRGLGRAMAEAMAEAGHTILGCGRDREELRSLGAELGKEHELERVDVTDAAAVDAWGEAVLAGGAAPDLLLNNAGVINRQAPLWER